MKYLLQIQLGFIFIMAASNANADIYNRIDGCEERGGGSCIYDIMRELASNVGDPSSDELQSATSRTCTRSSSSGATCYNFDTEIITGKYCKEGKVCGSDSSSGATCYYYNTTAACGNNTCSEKRACGSYSSSGATCYYYNTTVSCE